MKKYVCHCMHVMYALKIALFAVHSTWLRCISVCISVMITVLEFVHVCTGTYYVCYISYV